MQRIDPAVAVESMTDYSPRKRRRVSSRSRFDFDSFLQHCKSKDIDALGELLSQCNRSRNDSQSDYHVVVSSLNDNNQLMRMRDYFLRLDFQVPDLSFTGKNRRELAVILADNLFELFSMP